MLDILMLVPVVAVFVLVLFVLVQFVVGFFPSLKSPRLSPPTGKWWIVLLLLLPWLISLLDVLNQGSPVSWRRKEYFNLICLLGISYCVVYVWKWSTKPTETVKPDSPLDDKFGVGDTKR